jgi:HEAT repeat protein
VKLFGNGQAGEKCKVGPRGASLSDKYGDELVLISSLDLSSLDHAATFSAVQKLLQSGASTEECLLILELFAVGPDEVRVQLLDGIDALPKQIGRLIARSFCFSSSYSVRNACAEAFQLVAEEEDISILAKLLNDRHWMVRASAASSLSEFHSDKVAGIIEKRWSKEQNADVRRYLAVSLTTICGERAMAALQEHLEQEQDEFAKIGIYTSMIELGKLEAVRELAAQVDSGDVQLAIVVLSCLGDQVRDLSAGPVRDEAVALLNRLSDSSPDETIRKHATSALRNALTQDE